MVEAPAMSWGHFGPQHPPSRGDSRRYGGLGFVTDARLRDSREQIPPPPAQAALIPEPNRSWQAEALGHARQPTCPDLPGWGLHGSLRVNFGVVNALDRRAWGAWIPSRARS